MSQIHRRILLTLVILSGCLVFVTPRLGNSGQYGRMTEMHLVASPNNWIGRCPVTINFNGFIRVDGPNTVTYGITRSDGAKGLGQQTLHFSGPGRQPVHFTWRLGRGVRITTAGSKSAPASRTLTELSSKSIAISRGSPRLGQATSGRRDGAAKGIVTPW